MLDLSTLNAHQTEKVLKAIANPGRWTTVVDHTVINYGMAARMGPSGTRLSTLLCEHLFRKVQGNKTVVQANNGGHPVLRLTTDALIANALTMITDGVIDIGSKYGAFLNMSDLPVVVAVRPNDHPADVAYHKANIGNAFNPRLILYRQAATATFMPTDP
jgi:hypothetical protein